MKISRTIRLASTLTLSLAAAAAQADGLRCGSALVKVGDTMLHVLEKCGEPILKEKISGADERLLEQWIYKGGSREFQRVLTFSGVELIRIETVGMP